MARTKKDLEILIEGLKSRKKDYDYLIRRYHKKMLDNIDSSQEYNRYLEKANECRKERDELEKQIELYEVLLDWIQDKRGA